jgi:nicotinamide phosphoribosyltransferase
MGTDTIRAMEFAIKYYNADLNDLAYSVPASEHSIMTAKGRAGETEVVRQLLEEYPKGILSIVADSYDVFNFTENIIGGTFKDAILNRDGKVVIRPDSGDPESVTKKLINILGDKFGYTENKKGYKVLNPKVGLIWGDGLSVSDIRAILGNLAIDGWSSENIVMGMGGGLLQKVNRDTQRFAFKCSAQLQGNEWVDIQKDPIHAGKKSKKGRLSLIKQDGVYTTIPYSDNCNDVLETVFENGEIVKEYTFSEIRKNAELK